MMAREVSRGFAQKVFNVTSDDLWQEIFLTQRRKGATKTPRNAVALCAFAPLREKSSSHQALLVQSRFTQRHKGEDAKTQRRTRVSLCAFV
jgi:hypothetical protein